MDLLPEATDDAVGLAVAAEAEGPAGPADIRHRLDEAANDRADDQLYGEALVQLVAFESSHGASRSSALTQAVLAIDVATALARLSGPVPGGEAAESPDAAPPISPAAEREH